ncbi:hypothetical protein AUJ13_01180 [Candidatus Micrarchaeota archaeon CG1_02_49_24]|nr:MAG: hypothetical protein AUJ13_01180 [Candidatus Micrarchaeota archaeon CG1_02_49_24]
MSVASARTCYSTEIIYPNDISDGQKERLGKMLFDSGHHTPFQHPTFVFALSGVSRHLVWSFLHSHPYYNSEQSSQRYNILKHPEAFIPPNLTSGQKTIYENAIEHSWQTYFQLTENLKEELKPRVTSLYKRQGFDDTKLSNEIEKKSAENARYALPISAGTSLYHTISLLTLKRYIAMAQSSDVPYEASLLARNMADEVERVSPGLLSLGEVNFSQPFDSPALTLTGEQMASNERLNKSFDENLGDVCTKLMDFTKNADAQLCSELRNVLGPISTGKSDEQLVDLALNPKQNPYLLSPLNVWHHSPIMRPLQNISYSFLKRISHTADSQEQRHRTLPASRPLLSMRQTYNPDYITPFPITHCNPIGIYKETMNSLWQAKDQLMESGVPPEFSVYVLPNAVSIRYTESGSLLNFMHKWRLRLCFNAQAEIWEHSLGELAQVAAVHPTLVKYIGPPCFFRSGYVKDDKLKGPCPEAVWCGVPVWRNFPQVRRPF